MSEVVDDSDPPTTLDKTGRPPSRQIDKYIPLKIPFVSTRHTLLSLTFLGFFITFGMMSNLYACQNKLAFLSLLQNNVVLSYFWGFLISQISGGYLVSFFPANRLFGAAIFVLSISNLLVPLSFKEITLLLLSKLSLLQGVVQGLMYVACHAIWRFWSPPTERTQIALIAFSGSYAGVFLSVYLVRLMNWKATFCFYGAFGVIWWIFWIWLVFEKPRHHPGIDESELKYIENSMGDSTRQTPTFSMLPLLDIARSKSVRAVVLANFCKSFGFFALAKSTVWYWDKSYSSQSNDSDDSEDSEDSEIDYTFTYMLMALFVAFVGILADYLIKSDRVSTVNVRKLFTCGSLVLDIILFFLLTTTFIPTKFLVINFLFINFAVSNCNVNLLDIAPQYSGILIGLSSGISTVAVLLFGTVATNCGALDVVAIGFLLLGATYYALFASGELQRWSEFPTVEREVLNAVTADNVSGVANNIPEAGITINIPITNDV